VFWEKGCANKNKGAPRMEKKNERKRFQFIIPHTEIIILKGK
jgi:hypothetical protein